MDHYHKTIDSIYFPKLSHYFYEFLKIIYRVKSQQSNNFPSKNNTRYRTYFIHLYKISLINKLTAAYNVFL